MNYSIKTINLLDRNPSLRLLAKRCYATQNSLDAMKASLATKGFLRPCQSYTPPLDAAEKVKAICADLQVSSATDHKLRDLKEKFNILNICSREFNHTVSNNEMHEIRTVGDVIRFYTSALDTVSPYDALKRMELPENLHIQYEYVRFHPDTDTKFGGKSAFPKSSTLVTGLKYRKKYQGYEAKQSWP